MEGDRASISAELAGPEERMRRLEKHRESDIMASDPAHLVMPSISCTIWRSGKATSVTCSAAALLH